MSEFETNADLFAVARLSAQTMIVGAPSTMSSSCGPNCSYTLNFEAPYFQCSPLDISYNLSTRNFYSVGEGVYPIFQGEVFDPYLSLPLNAQYTINTTTGIKPSRFTFTAYEALGLQGIYGSSNESIANRVTSLSCNPASIVYTVNYNFTNNILSTNVSSGLVKSITDLAAPVQNGSGITFPGFVDDEGMQNDYAVEQGVGVLGQEPLNWTSDWRSWYSNLQMMAVINSVARSLNGTYIATAALFGNTTNKLPPAWGLGNNAWQTDIVWVDDAEGFPTNSIGITSPITLTGLLPTDPSISGPVFTQYNRRIHQTQ